MLTKNRIKQSFASAATSYDGAALLQRRVALNLLQRLGPIGQTDTIVDLGCGTGFVANSLQEQLAMKVGQIIALDLALPMLQKARIKPPGSHSVNYLCADAELLPFQQQSVDWIISNLAFQWCNLEKVLGEVKRVLKPGNGLYFTTFGENTLCELKKAWQAVDNYQHVNSFYNVAQLTDLLSHTGFQIVELQNETYLSNYGSVWELMAELKQLGAHTVVTGCSKHLMTKSKLQRMIAAYEQQDKHSRIAATFDIITASVKA